MKKYVNLKLLATTLCLLVVTIEVYSQQIPEPLKARLAGKTTLKAVMADVTDYYNSISPLARKDSINDKNEFESPMSFWYKWERYMAPRLNAKGEFVNIQAHLNSINDSLQNTTAKNKGTLGNTTSKWTFAGPFGMNHYGGSLRGLGRLDCIAFHPTDPNTFWVGSPVGGVWKTMDGGASWLSISLNLPTMAVSSIAVSPSNPDIIYILTGDPSGGSFRGLYNRNRANAGTFIWKTTDGGHNWLRCTDLVGLPQWGNQVEVHPTNANIIYVGHSAGLSRSIDGGASWLPRNIVVEVTDVKLKPGTPATVYAATSGGVLYSTDNAQSFTASTLTGAGNGRKLLATTAANPNVLYLLCSGVPAANSFNGLYRSINSGVDFSLRGNTPNIFSANTTGMDAQDLSGYCYALTVNPADASNVVAAGTITWGTTDGGTTLTNYTDYFENTSMMSRYVHPDIHGLAFNPLNGNLYSVNDGGIWRSTNQGIAWADITSNIHVSTFYSLAGFAGNANLLAGGNQDNGVKYRNNGVPYAGDFTHVRGGDGFDAAFDATNSNRWYASGNENIYRFNQGVYEKDISPPGRVNGTDGQNDYYPSIATDPSAGNKLYVLYTSGIRRSTDAGDNWTNVSQGVVSGNRNSSDLVVCHSNTNRLYATNGTSIWRTDNSGGAWSGDLANNPGFNTTATITALAVWPANADVIYAAIGSINNPGNKVLYSTNAGATWQNISGTLPDVPVLSIAVDQNNNAYIGTDLGVFYQASSSNDWTPYYNGLPRVPVSALVINQGAGLIRAATYGRGIWQAPLFSPCDVNIFLSGAQASNQFYEVSNQINSNASVVGGSGTNIIYRAGNEVVLSPGFEVYETNTFRGYIGPCETSPVPLAKMAQKPWLSSYSLPASSTSLLPHGSIALLNLGDSSMNVQVNAVDTGNFIITLTSASEDDWLTNREMTITKTGIQREEINLPALPPGKYLLQLFFNRRLVHYQEVEKMP